MRSTDRCKKRVARVALVAFVLGLPGLALAKKQKRTVSATIAGKHITWKGRLVLIHDTTEGFFTVIATKNFATKTIGVGCGLLLVAGQTVTPTGCSLNYMVRKGRHSQSWLNTGLDPSNPVQVTVSFDGTIVQGSFSGSLQPTTFGAGPALGVQGTFRGPLGP
jgi:hypothetical protein